jgi:hypothetical protein
MTLLHRCSAALLAVMASSLPALAQDSGTVNVLVEGTGEQIQLSAEDAAQLCGLEGGAAAQGAEADIAPSCTISREAAVQAGYIGDPGGVDDDGDDDGEDEAGDDDNGHGNDADGADDGNPGNSDGVGGGSDDDGDDNGSDDNGGASGNGGDGNGNGNGGNRSGGGNGGGGNGNGGNG